MRKFSLFVLSVAVALSSTGCIMVIGGYSRVGKPCGQKRLIEIDGEVYVIDLKEKTGKKIDEESTTTIEVETSTEK